MKEVLLKLAERVDASEIVWFLLDLIFLAIIVMLIQQLRKKDKIFLEMLNKFYSEMAGYGDQLTQNTAVLSFLAFNKGLKTDEQAGEEQGNSSTPN